MRRLRDASEIHPCPLDMDRVGVIVKNVIFWKVKSGHVVVYTPFKSTEAVKRFFPSIHVSNRNDLIRSTKHQRSNKH